MYKRELNILELLSKKSFFLFGPRQTGKSTLLREKLPQAKFFNLNQADTFRLLSGTPEALRQGLADSDNLVVVDEIQKLPNLLSEIQVILDNNSKMRVVLTGSSARKLNRDGINLLGGRAWKAALFPLVTPELPTFDLEKRLTVGGIPSIYDSANPYEELQAYIGMYLSEEVRAEALVRSIEVFSRFLTVAATTNAEEVNFSSVANDAQVPDRTIHEYYQVLVDTLIGFMIPPFAKTVKRKPVARSKFFLFDIGVANALVNRKQVSEGTPEFGKALEHMIALELRAYLSYRRINFPLTYWRTLNRQEVDFVIGDEVAIEVKGKQSISPRDLKGLIALAEEIQLKRRIVVCRETMWRRLDNGIEIYPLEKFLRELWSGEILGV